jgi:hypothetical protein
MSFEKSAAKGGKSGILSGVAREPSDICITEAVSVSKHAKPLASIPAGFTISKFFL